MCLLSILLITFYTTCTCVSEKIACDGVIFNNVYFDKKAIVSNLGRPYNLVMHKFSGILFFSHTIESVTQVDFGIMACLIEKDTCFEVKGVNGGYAVAYDSGNDDIYFGGHDGIYKYNFLTKSADYFAEQGKSIWSIFIRRNFYYIEYPTQKLHVLQDDDFVHVAEASRIEIDNFFSNKQGDVYYSNKTALFKVPKKTRSLIVLNDEIIVRQIAEDSYGDIYFCASDGIYIDNRPLPSVRKIADIEHAFGLTFDEHDHVIYSDKDTIYKLVPSRYNFECLAALKAAKEKDGRKKK